MHRRVVITGLGPVTAMGAGVGCFFDALFRHEPCILPIPHLFQKQHNLRSRHYVPLPEISLSEYGIPARAERLMEDHARLAVAAAWLAFRDAGFHVEQGTLPSISGMGDCAVLLGIGFSGLKTCLASHLAHVNPDGVFSAGKPRFNRMVIPMTMPSSAAAWISILFGLKGVQHTLNASCASGTVATGEAFHLIRSGRCDAALAGGVESLRDPDGAIMRGFDTLGTLTANREPLPFSAARDGFLFSEGAACVLVLESLERAVARNARIYAEITGYAANSDACHIVQIDPSGDPVYRLLESLSRDRRIDYFNAHGTGTIPNDAIEADVLLRLFGDCSSQPVIESTKRFLGHAIGASGALEAAVTAFAVHHDRLPGSPVPEPLPDLNLAMGPVRMPVRCALSASYGFGGHNAALRLEKYTG